jgi:hypothetical protein
MTDIPRAWQQKITPRSDVRGRRDCVCSQPRCGVELARVAVLELAAAEEFANGTRTVGAPRTFKKSAWKEPHDESNEN